MLIVLANTFLINIVYAADLSDPSLKGSFNALGSGYAIGRWSYSDGDLPLGSQVQVRASTTNMDTTHVIFVWKANDGEIYRSGKIPLVDNGDTWETAPIKDAYDAQILNVAGDWGVQAYFYDDPDAPIGDSLASGKYAIKAISFHPFVIPEVTYGTITGLLTLVGALIYIQKITLIRA